MSSTASACGRHAARPAAAAPRWATGLGLAVGCSPRSVRRAVALMLVAAWTVHRGNGFFIVKEGWEYNLVLARRQPSSRRWAPDGSASTVCCSRVAASASTTARLD